MTLPYKGYSVFGCTRRGGCLHPPECTVTAHVIWGDVLKRSLRNYIYKK